MIHETTEEKIAKLNRQKEAIKSQIDAYQHQIHKWDMELKRVTFTIEEYTRKS